MFEAAFDYVDGADVCEGFIAYKDDGARKPCVLVAHQWAGLSDHERQVARDVAALGYVGLAIDVYGKGVRGGPEADNAALMNPWVSDRLKLRHRLLAAVSAAAAHAQVDPDRIAVVGYCFGGLCALDLARSGDPRVKGAVSVHGVFAPTGLPSARISAAVLVLHGYEDPMAPPADMVALADELTAGGGDWQIHAYGRTVHAFTAVGVDLPAMGLRYDAAATRRSTASRNAFLQEVFGV